MVFSFHSNQWFSEATRGVMTSVFVIGLMLIGFGVLILTIPEFFIIIAAGLFFIAGMAVLGFAAKLFFVMRRFGKEVSGQDAYRKNVKIHIEEHHDV